MTALDDLQIRIRDMADARDWAQFHTPKNLAMALAGEVGELLAEFQWLSPAQAGAVMEDDARGPAIRRELGDVAVYLVRLADVLGVDLIAAAHSKLDETQERYDVETYRGSAVKAPHLAAAQRDVRASDEP